MAVGSWLEESVFPSEDFPWERVGSSCAGAWGRLEPQREQSRMAECLVAT